MMPLLVRESGNTIKFDDCIIEEYDAVRILQIKKLLLEEGITSVCLPLNIKESAHLNQIKYIYIYIYMYLHQEQGSQLGPPS